MNDPAVRKLLQSLIIYIFPSLDMSGFAKAELGEIDKFCPSQLKWVYWMFFKFGYVPPIQVNALATLKLILEAISQKHLCRRIIWLQMSSSCFKAYKYIHCSVWRPMGDEFGELCL